jgi:DNA-binding transcriptional ArsR family regulator
MKQNLPDHKRCERIASLFKTLSHPQRLFMLCCLCEGDLTVSDLEKACGASQPVISQHLTRMRLEGLVDSRREGNFVYYRLTDNQIPALIQSLEKIFGP